MQTTYRPLRIALGSLAVFAAAFAAWGTIGWGSPAANEQAIGEISRWCERVSGGFLREPVNTLGNLAFIVAGLTMFATLARDELRGRTPNSFYGNSPVAVLYAAAAVFLGPGSMVMHGTHTRFGAWIDNVSMVAFILVPWLFNVSRMACWSHRTLFRWYSALLGAYAFGYWFIGPQLGIGLDLFAVSIGVWAISEVLYRLWSPAARWWSGFVGFAVAAVFGITPGDIMAAPGAHWWMLFFWIPGLLATHRPPGRRRYPLYWVGVASFLAAYRIWLTGTATDPACAPDSLIQAHATWHVLSASATLAFFFFLRTERRVEAHSPRPERSAIA